MSQKLDTSPTAIGIDIGKNSFHIVDQNQRGTIVLRQKWSRGQVEARLANMPPCLIGMEAWVGAHHLSRRLQALGHDARLMPAKYVWPYSKGQKNDFRDAEAIAEAVQRPTMKFVATKTADQLDLQALHRVRERLVKVKPARWESHGLKSWIGAAKKRLHRNVLAIALANKLARIARSVLARVRAFETSKLQAA
jgi:transposase